MNIWENVKDKLLLQFIRIKILISRLGIFRIFTICYPFFVLIFISIDYFYGLDDIFQIKGSEFEVLIETIVVVIGIFYVFLIIQIFFISKLILHWQFTIYWLLFLILVLTIIYFLFPIVSNFYGLSIQPSGEGESHSEIISNLSSIVWMVFSFLGLSIGIWLAIWGRLIQHKSHLHERYEKAAAMLGDEVMAVRIAGCRSLMSLGIEDKKMKMRCVSLLFAFISDPYLKLEHQGKSLDRIFPSTEPLRLDIQEAANSFSAIYNYYKGKKMGAERVALPSYFWKSIKRVPISLIKANLRKANLHKAHLRGAKLKMVKLHRADLQEAYLRGADMRDARLWKANLKEADLIGVNLRKANLQGANLSNANFRNADLQNASLEGAQMQNTDLRKVNLQGANLKEVELEGADLRSGKLQLAKLQRAKLQDAKLRGSKLHKANLTGANLQGADLQSANLRGANLTGANITDAKINSVWNLTKKQMLSAVWGGEHEGEGSPPSPLSKKLIRDVEVKNWLETWTYIKKEVVVEIKAEELAETEAEEDAIAETEEEARAEAEEKARAEARAEAEAEAEAFAEAFAEAVEEEIAKREKEKIEDMKAEEEWKRNR